MRMKKSLFMGMAVIAALSLFATSCKKDDNKKTNDDNGGENTTEIAIDGNFSDWDALTAETANEHDVIVPIDENYNGIKAFKVSSDDVNLYLYAEIDVSKIQVSETAKEGGNSWDGHGDASPGPFIVYLDLDGNASTGFTTHTDENYKPATESDPDYKALVDGIGCEIGAEDYWFISATNGQMYLGWSQLIVENEQYTKDGDSYQQPSWWTGQWDTYQGTDVNGGWNPNFDNLTPRLENYKTAIVGAVAKVEMAFSRGDLASHCYRHEMGDTINIAAGYYNNGQTASSTIGAGGFGNPYAIPVGLTKAATVKLR